MSNAELFDALAKASGGTAVEGALRAIDPDDTRIGERLWKALRADPSLVVAQPTAWRFLAQAPPGSFSATDVNVFFRTLSQSAVPRLDPSLGRIPWDPSFDTIVDKIVDDRQAATVDDGVAAPMQTALRVAMVRHDIADAQTWGHQLPHDWLEILLPVWDRNPGFADEFTRIWPTERHGSLAVSVAADPETALQTTDFLNIYAPFAHPEERVRIVLNVDSPHALERALSVLEDDHRANMTVIYGTEKKWYERVFDDFGSWLFGAHGLIGGPGLLGFVIGAVLFRLFEIPFTVLIICIALTFGVWRTLLAISYRPALPWDDCKRLASSDMSRGLVAGWIVYRRSLAGQKFDPTLIDDFFDGLASDFPEPGRPSRLRTVIDINLQQLEPVEQERKILQVFDDGAAIENWAILEFSTSAAVARAAIEASSLFADDDVLPTAAVAPPVALDSLRHLAAHHQELFLDALDDGRGAEDALVFAIGEARGDGVLDSLGRKLGQGSDAMRSAIVTALANYGKAALPAVERALASEDAEHRRDGAEVAWRLDPGRNVIAAVRAARAGERDPQVRRLLTCVEIRQRFEAATGGVDPLDAGATSLAMESALEELDSDPIDLQAPEGLAWQMGTPVGPGAALGLARIVEAFDGNDARLLPIVSSISQQLALESRDRWAQELFETDVDVLAAIAIAGPAATLSMRASTETIEALARMATPSALIRLDGIAHDDPDPGLRRRAYRQLYRVAEARGQAVYELFEHSVRVLPPEATIDPIVARIVEAQAERVLHEAMVAKHRWRMEKWRELWADSPLFARLVGRVVWAIYDYGLLRQTFRLDESGDPVDVNDEPVKLEQFTEIGLPVPAAFDRKERRSWNTLLADYEIVSPFAQMERDMEPREISELVLFGPDLRSLLTRGWYPSTPGLELHYGFLRPFPRLGITASLEISPGVGDDDEQPQTIDTLAFVDGIHSEFPSISRLLKDVPREAQIQVAEELWLAARASDT